MNRLHSLRLLTALAFVLTLAACESSEERAEGHYQSSLALLEEGDVERALVELRNVFQLDGAHRDARALYARTVLEQGQTSEAYGQYLRLVEQYPNDVEGRLVLSELSFLTNNWDEFTRHSTRALELAPDDPRAKVIAAAGDYRDAALDEDVPRRQAAAAVAQTLVEMQPENQVLQRVLIDSYLQDGKYGSALTELDRALEREPGNRLLYNQKLSVLNQLGDADAIEELLVGMIDRFPEDQNLKGVLIRYYMSRGKTDQAETFLRKVVETASEENSDTYLALIQFLIQVRGPDVALAELEEGIAASPDDAQLRTLRAGIEFDQGKRDKAIADLEALLVGAEPSDAIRKAKVTLTRMLIETGNEVGARRLVEQVLEEDPGQVDALKMRATWHIEADEVEQAVGVLRRALDQNPQDAQAMTLMAQAYTRGGNPELARDFMSLAVEASGGAPAESIRYARLLRSEGRMRPAEDTLVAALRSNPNNVQLLSELGKLYLAAEDVSRVQQVQDTLRRLEQPQATQAADELQVNLVNMQGGTVAAVEFLEGLAQESGNLATKIAIVRARLAGGDTEEALRYATGLLKEDPENATLRYVMHAAQAANGDLENAAAGYEELIKEDPMRERIWLELLRIKAAQGKNDDLEPLLEDALKVMPDSPNLLWAQASFMERSGNIDGAIEIYEGLYERLSTSPVVANNLASLISAHRDDDASLERAYIVARRLRGTTVPAFQDTYGWIQHRRGDHQDALQYLEPAAKTLSGDALVQYHLAMVYLALNRPEDALRQFQRAVDVAGVIDTRPQIEKAREQIRLLQE